MHLQGSRHDTAQSGIVARFPFLHDKQHEQGTCMIRKQTLHWRRMVAHALSCCV